MLHCLEELTISNELEIRRKQRLQQPQATKTDEVTVFISSRICKSLNEIFITELYSEDFNNSLHF